MTTCPRCRRGTAYPLRENPDSYECMNCGLTWGARDPAAKPPPPRPATGEDVPRGVAFGIVLSAILVAAVYLAVYAIRVVLG